jgi:hypothetical protein
VILFQGLAAGDSPFFVAVVGQQLAPIEGARDETVGKIPRYPSRACRGEVYVCVNDEILLGAQVEHPVAKAKQLRPTPRRAEGPPGHVKGLMEVVCGRLGRPFGPQGLHHLLAMEAMALREREKLHDILGPPKPPRRLGYGSTIDEHGEPSEEVHLHAAVLRGFLDRGVLTGRPGRHAGQHDSPP